MLLKAFPAPALRCEAANPCFLGFVSSTLADDTGSKLKFEKQKAKESKTGSLLFPGRLPVCKKNEGNEGKSAFS